MEWQDDEALILDVKPQGDAHAVAWLLARSHGLHAGLVRGGQGKGKSALLQTGNRVRAVWRGRLEEQLGDYRLEMHDAIAARFFDMPIALACLRSAAEILRRSLPERQAYPRLYDATLALFSLENEMTWLQSYIRWELGLLTELGFGLDLTSCALTGQVGNLAYISPKTGRAVSADAGHQWRERLLPIPSFLGGKAQIETLDLLTGLQLTGFFLARYVFAGRILSEKGDNLPPSRQHLLSLIAKEASVVA